MALVSSALLSGHGLRQRAWERPSRLLLKRSDRSVGRPRQSKRARPIRAGGTAKRTDTDRGAGEHAALDVVPSRLEQGFIRLGVGVAGLFFGLLALAVWLTQIALLGGIPWLLFGFTFISLVEFLPGAHARLVPEAFALFLPGVGVLWCFFPEIGGYMAAYPGKITQMSWYEQAMEPAYAWLSAQWQRLPEVAGPGKEQPEAPVQVRTTSRDDPEGPPDLSDESLLRRFDEDLDSKHRK